MERVEAGGDSGDLALRTRQRDAGLEQTDSGAGTAVAFRPLLVRKRERDPDFGGFTGGIEAFRAVGESEARRHHADNAIGLGVQRKILAEDIQVGREICLPHGVTDHRHQRGARSIVTRVDAAAHHGRDPESREELAGDTRNGGAGSSVASLQVARFHREQGEVGKGVALTLPIEEVSIRWSPGLQGNVGDARVRFPKVDETIGMAVRQGAQEHPVDHTEDGGSGADPDGERRDSENGEARTLAQRARPKTEILEHGRKQVGPAFVAACFLRAGHRPEFQDSAAQRFVAGTPAAIRWSAWASMWARISASISDSASAGWRVAFHQERRRVTALILLRGGSEDARHEPGHLLPAVRFAAKLTASGRRQSIIFGFALVVGFAPLAGDEALVFQAVERGVERTLLDFEAVAGDLLDAEENAVSVQWAEGDGLEDQKVERALQKIDAVRHTALLDGQGKDGQGKHINVLLERQGEVAAFCRVTRVGFLHGAPSRPCYHSPVLQKSPQEEYSRADIRRQFGLTERQLRSWEERRLISPAETYTFSDLIALQTIVKLREQRIPVRRIGQAIQSLRTKLDWIKEPLSELRIVSDGRRINVHVAGQKMEAISGQILLDFEASSLGGLRSFPDRKSTANRLRESELWFQKGLDLEETGAPIEEAVAAYRKVLELNPVAAGALVNLGTIYYRQRKFAEAEKYYVDAIAADPEYALAQFNLGNLFDEAGAGGRGL